jgi:hypothetical protein
MRNMLLGSTALALVLAITPAYSQMQQKGGAEEKSAPQATEKGKGQNDPSIGKGSAQSESKQPAKGAETQSKEQGAKGTAETQPKDKGAKGTAETQPKDKGTKGTAETQPKEQGTKGSAQTQPKEQGTKGTAETQPKDKGTKGTAETQPKDKATKGTAETQPREQGKGTAETQPGQDKSSASKSEKSGDRVQLSEQQRSSVHQTVLKERNVNRVNQVNFSISVGTRVPRSVQLVALPASVISLVPQYRSYRYFVANDEICIVDPSSYEIVEVIAASDRTARGGDRDGSGMLTLTAEEKRIIIENVEMRGDSTLALGSLNEGSPVPREARLQVFPDVVVEKVPKVRGYKFFTAEDRIAIADEQGSKVALVIDAKR